MLDVHQLKIFASVAENLSFTKAAERLFLTQSAVSHQIARLEREIGCAVGATRPQRGAHARRSGDGNPRASSVCGG